MPAHTGIAKVLGSLIPRFYSHLHVNIQIKGIPECQNKGISIAVYLPLSSKSTYPLSGLWKKGTQSNLNGLSKEMWDKADRPFEDLLRLGDSRI